MMFFILICLLILVISLFIINSLTYKYCVVQFPLDLAFQVINCDSTYCYLTYSECEIKPVPICTIVNKKWKRKKHEKKLIITINHWRNNVVSGKPFICTNK